MGRLGAKLGLLLWKNWKLQVRHPVQTAAEVLVPVLFSLLIVQVRLLVDPELKPGNNFTEFQPLSFDGFINSTTREGESFRVNVAWSPREKSPKFAEELRALFALSNKLEELEVQEFESEEALMRKLKETKAMDLNDSSILLAGIVFHDNEHPDDPQMCSPGFEMTLHFPGELRMAGPMSPLTNWRTNLLYPMYQTLGPRDPLSVSRWPLGLHRFPYLEYTQDPLLDALQTMMSLMIMISFVFTCIFTVMAVTNEKEKQLKEAMKIMGLPGGLHWLAWFIKTLLLLVVAVLLITIMMKVRWETDPDKSVLPGASSTLFFVFLLLYMVASICFCFMISVFFSKANVAAIVAGLLWFLSYAPYSFQQPNYETLSLASKLSASLCSNSAMGFGLQLFIMYEGAGGLGWEDLWRPVTQDDDMTLGQLMLMLLLDSFIYMLITLYVEAIFPGDFGVPRPWYFPVQRSYWLGPGQPAMEANGAGPPQSSASFEPEPTHLPVGVRIRSLRKVFGRDKVAVDGLTLNMYEGQITVLLGHNGAGKTTTMSMLTGMYTPSGGTAEVAGYDVIRDTDAVRDSLGLCPQHNVLFDELTVREHLFFFGRLKGLSGNDLEEEIVKYVRLLQLQPKENKRAGTLSGGMKRKLAAGIAFCGRSKVVMFDEPTSGMDPAARRALWDLLQEEKVGRTVLLSTHFMDEADLLGDRIAIMAGGRLQCCGSSFFLKKQYGAGYRLTAVKGPSCESAAVTALLQRHLPGLAPAQDVGSELSYQLQGAQAGRFEPMLAELEAACGQLHVLSYGVSLTTMEEVFMKVGKDREVAADDSSRYAGAYKNRAGNLGLAEAGPPPVKFAGELSPVFTNGSLSGKAKMQVLPSLEAAEGAARPLPLRVGRLRSGAALMPAQLEAMVRKKALAYMRGWILFLVECALPVLFLVITIAIVHVIGMSDDLPPMRLSLEEYHVTKTVVAVTNASTRYPLPQHLGCLHELYTHRVCGSPLPTHCTHLSGNGSGGGSGAAACPQLVDLPPRANASEALWAYLQGQLGQANTRQFRQTHIVAATFDYLRYGDWDLPHITGWFGDLPFHAVPVALNMLFNAVLSVMGVAINLVNAPLPYTHESKMALMMSGNNLGFQLAFNAAFSMSFVAAYYVLFPVKERVSKAKHLQFVSGARAYIFWTAHLLCDGLSFVLPALGIVVTLAIAQEDGFSTFDELGRMLLILACFGWAVIPFMYLASFAFNAPVTAYVGMTLLNILLGNAAFIVVTVMQLPDLNLLDVSESLGWAMLVCPHFTLADAIRYSYVNYVTATVCGTVNCSKIGNQTHACCPGHCSHDRSRKDACAKYSDNYFAWELPGIGRHIVFFLAMGFAFLLLVTIIELRLGDLCSGVGGARATERARARRRRRSARVAPGDPEAAARRSQPEPEDTDVLQEKQRIRSSPLTLLSAEFGLVLRDVSKLYGKLLAVDRLCVGVRRGECFGLLGVNGAGKTTTFKMMTGDERISAGQAFLDGLDLRTDMKQVHRRIGYCPQFDALIEEMTGRETLHMFCLLRGVPRKRIAAIVSRFADELLFTKHIDKKVKEYSGGNKRKLSTAVALVGDPQIVFLDEPTTGMDPVARRHLWNVICRVRDSGRSIVLTSHSMEECEALCTRLAIMVNGDFKCLGSTQHLKNKFAQGYTLTLKVNQPHSSLPAIRSESPARSSPTMPPSPLPLLNSLTSVKNFISTSFQEAELREEYMGLLTYYIPSSNLTWSQMFGMMERAKEQLHIEDYSLGQTSLEQVFLTFTKAQQTAP